MATPQEKPQQQQHLQQPQKFTDKFGQRRRLALRSCRNQCSMTGFQNHGTCCTRCTKTNGPHAADCSLKNSRVCGNQCGWTAFDGHGTCCSSCKGGFGPHASDCALKNARVVVDRTQKPSPAPCRRGPAAPAPQEAPTPQQQRRPRPQPPQQQEPLVNVVPPLPGQQLPQQALRVAQQGAGPLMAVTVPAHWRPGDGLQVPHPLIPNATITVMVPANATPGATILLPIPQGGEGPTQPFQYPAPSAPPLEDAGENRGRMGGVVGAAVGAAGVVAGMCVAGALVGEAAHNGPEAAHALVGEALNQGQQAVDAGEDAVAGWANAGADWLENLF